MEAVSAALKKSFIAFDDHLRQEEVVQKMSAMREEGNAKGGAKVERDEDEEQEALWEEAIALSEESSVSLETIIRQYAQIKRRMLLKQLGRDMVPDEDEEEEDGDEESERAWRRRTRNANKRALNEPSSNLVKRRKMQRENATVDDGSEDGEEGSKAVVEEGKNGGGEEVKPSVNGPESESVPKLNGTKDEVAGNHVAEEEQKVDGVEKR